MAKAQEDAKEQFLRALKRIGKRLDANTEAVDALRESVEELTDRLDASPDLGKLIGGILRGGR